MKRELSPCHLVTPSASTVSQLRQQRAFIIWAVVALLWANLPYLVGYASSTPQNQFGGFFLYEQDGYSYLAKMRQGAQGAWEFHLPYTSEDEYQAGGIALMFYIVLGKFASLGVSYPLLYHGARLLSSVLLLIVLAKFIARFVTNRRWQVWTWWLLLFSGGWGLLASYLIDTRYVAYELITPDAFIFSILYGPPHVIFGLALLLLWLGHVLDCINRIPHRFMSLKELVVANLMGGLAALSREAYGPVFAGIFAAYLFALLLQQRRIPWREAAIIVASSLAAGAYGVYMLIAYRTIPAFIMWYQQNPFNSPQLLDFLLGFAPLMLLAAAGLYLHLKQRLASYDFVSSSARTFMLAWLIAGPILAYLPIAISRRLVAGWQIPLCLFGAYALLHWLSKPRLLQRVAVGFAIIALLPTTFLVIMGGTMQVINPGPPLFISADQQAALDWLGEHTTNRDVVLSNWRFGNLVPIYADARVFVGHPIETIHFTEKRAVVDQFFNPATTLAERQALIEQWKIDWIIIPSQQLTLPGQAPDFQRSGYAIYHVAWQD